MREILKLFVIFTLFIGNQSLVHGAIITFDNQAEFLTSTGATATDPLPNLGGLWDPIPGGASAILIVGELTFTIEPPSYELYSGPLWTDRIAGN